MPRIDLQRQVTGAIGDRGSHERAILGVPHMHAGSPGRIGELLRGNRPEHPLPPPRLPVELPTRQRIAVDQELAQPQGVGLATERAVRDGQRAPVGRAMS